MTSNPHKVGVWEINAPIFTAARRHQAHHGNVSIRKDGFSQQSSCHGNCRSAKKEGDICVSHHRTDELAIPSVVGE